MAQTSYGDVLRTPGAAAFTAAGLIGRLPLSMGTLGALLLVEQHTGSYAVAGAVSAALALGEAALGPLVSRLVDRYGQATVLPLALAVHAAGLVVLILLTLGDAWLPLLVLSAAVCGGALPPLGSCVRARWSAVLSAAGREGDLPVAFAWEAVVDEVVFVVGPVIVVAVSSAVDPVAGLLLALVFGTVGALGIAVQRSTQPAAHLPGADSGPAAIRFGGLRTLAAMAVGVGCLFGGLEVAMVAFADSHGSEGSAGPLLAVFAAGSGISGLAYGVRDWRWPMDRRLLAGLALLVVGSSPLLVAPSIPVMVPLALVAGLAVSPTMIVAFGLVERLLPTAVMTESFTWLTAGIGVGAALGAALAGLVADHADAQAPFVVCLGGAAAALLVVLPRRGSLRVAAG